MNRYASGPRRFAPRTNFKQYNTTKYCNTTKVEEIFPPKSNTNKSMRDRACLFRPTGSDFGQAVEMTTEGRGEFAKSIHISKISDPKSTPRLSHLKDVVRLLCETSCVDIKKKEKLGHTPNQLYQPEHKQTDQVKTSTWPAIAHPDGNLPSNADSFNDTSWCNVESVDDFNKMNKQEAPKSEKEPNRAPSHPASFSAVRISSAPRVKLIAEKFSLLRGRGAELRRRGERVVCLEYDVFCGERDAPVQTLRAFFSVRPSEGRGESESSSNQNSTDFNVEETLNILNEKEIEVIDESIPENRPYLQDLRQILRKNIAYIAKLNKSHLDLNYLYELANNNVNVGAAGLLSNKEWRDVRDLIRSLKTSSLHGISRKQIHPSNTAEKVEPPMLSHSFCNELLKEPGVN